MQENMQWYNEPAAWEARGCCLDVTTLPKSDFWRRTHYGFIRDTGHFFYQEVHGDFEVSVRVNGKYEALYDQAGLMLRVDEENWIKTGIEFFEGYQHASAVVTREFSDWSVTRLEGSPESFWLRVTRKAEAVEIFYSLDGQNFNLMRVCYLVPSAVTQVGFMCASPEGPGFQVGFEDYSVQPVQGAA